MKYQKKPEFVEAVQWDGWGATYQEIKKMNCGEVYRAGVWDNELIIYTLNQAIRAKAGDYIVKLPSGEIDCFSAAQFEAMYELLEPADCELTQENETIPVEPYWQERLYHDCREFNKLCEVRTGAWETMIKILKEAGVEGDEISECSQKIRARELEFRYKTLREILGKIEGVEL